MGMESFGRQASVSAGEQKINEYVARIQAGESKESIFEGLPDSFKSSIEEKLTAIEPGINSEDRKKLSGWEASYELAKIAQREGVDLSKISREEYVDYAIKNSLAIDDSQLRTSSADRMATSVEDAVASRKERRKNILENVDALFARFAYEMKEKASQDNRFLEDGIRVRQGTKDSNSWLFFGINKSITEGGTETFKSYISVKDLNTLTPDRFKGLMRALRDAGYNGDIKIFQDLSGQGLSLNDQMVMHGATEADAKLALNVAEKFFGDDVDQKGFGKDEVIDGSNTSYSQILAQKIRDAVKGSRR